MHKLAIIILCTMLANPSFARAEVPRDLASKAHETVETYHELDLFDGAVLIADGDEVIYQGGFGEADRSWDIPNSPDTRFRIASVTKQFTAALVLRLMEQGTIDLHAPIGTYLPEYPKPYGDQITVSQLLNHTSGIPNFTSLPGWNDRKRDQYSPRESVAYFWSRELEFEPGLQFSYSNSNYVVLGLIVEQVTGISFANALDQLILEPNGLDNTGYHARELIVPQMARGYVRRLRGYQPEEYVDASLPYSAGMLYSTVGDLHRWKRALHGGAVFEHPKTLALMLRSDPTTERNYGYGIDNAERKYGDEVVPIIAHGGRIEAFTTEDRYVPGEDWTIIVASNTFSNVNQIADDLLALMIEYEVSPPKSPIRWRMATTIENDGLAVALQEYEQLKAGQPEAFDFSENQLNVLGYEYLGIGDHETAIAIFELNTRAYPEAFNTWDSLGEGYFAAGRLEDAITNYRKSLALNPKNENAVLMIERIGAKAAE